MSTIYNTVRLQNLNQKWTQKKESGQVLTKKERNEREKWTSEDWMLQHFKEEMASNKEASKRTELDNKIISGGVLTPEEEQYLEQNDPEKLKKYRQMKAEKKAYEEKLRKCKTKDEVQRLKTQTLGGYLSALKKVENNPNIPMSEKLAQAQQYLAKTRNIQDAEAKFMATAQYQELPTEAEEAKDRAEENSREMDRELEEVMDAADQGDAEDDSTTVDGGKDTAGAGVDRDIQSDDEEVRNKKEINGIRENDIDTEATLDEKSKTKKSDAKRKPGVSTTNTVDVTDILAVIQRISVKAGAGNGSTVDFTL